MTAPGSETAPPIAVLAAAHLAAAWYARPNDLIGGWCVMPSDEPPSSGTPEVASFASETVAQHIAELHNEWLERLRAAGGESRVLVDPRAALTATGVLPDEVYDRLVAADRTAAGQPELREEDLRVDVWRNGAVASEMQRCSVRITHLPSGLVATADGRSPLETKARVLSELARRVAAETAGDSR